MVASWSVAGPPDHIAVIDLDSDTTFWTFSPQPRGAYVGDPYFSPDGDHVVAASGGSQARSKRACSRLQMPSASSCGILDLSSGKRQPLVRDTFGDGALSTS